MDTFSKNISHNITLLGRIRKYLSHQSWITSYKSYNLSHIDYIVALYWANFHMFQEFTFSRRWHLGLSRESCWCISKINSAKCHRQLIPKRKLCVSNRALQYNGTTLYNTLSSITQSSQTLARVKHNTFKHFIWAPNGFNVIILLYTPLYIICTLPTR